MLFLLLIGALFAEDGAPPGAPVATSPATTAAPASAPQAAPSTASPTPAPPPAMPGAAWNSPSLGAMKWISPGSFRMGRPLSESPSPQQGNEGEFGRHGVTLTRGYWMMEHEVTEAEWVAVMGEPVGPRGSCGAECPVTWTSWDQALTFAKLAGARDGVEYRLPTEAEWEYAARAGQEYLYAGGDDPQVLGWIAENSRGAVHPVCQKKRNAFGLCDMTGNVLERVANCYSDYPTGSVTDPSPFLYQGCEHILRGGDWGSEAAKATVTARTSDDRAYKNRSAGLRLVRSAP